MKRPCSMLIETEKQKKENLDFVIQRIEVRTEGLTYSKFITGLAKSKIKLDRKVL